ncbi:MAG TPA: MCE family protein [Aeromicrobium sp.]|nr:MCE family protein [Aeromicrobium sp.]
MTNRMDRESTSALVKLIIFCVLTGLATILLGMTLSNGGFAKRDAYKAMFTDVTGVASGDEVRIAGVRVGTIRGVEIADKDKAIVEFGVDPDIKLTQNTTATLRFRNLVGQRYMALAQGSEGATTEIQPGSTIPLSRTKEALDLDLFLSGFKPVFQALSPSDVNKLAFEIIQTLQGESGNVETLLGSVSSLTQTLAGRDRLIGDVIKNLSKTLDIIGSRDAELSTTISTLREFIGGLKDDRKDILNSLDGIADLTDETAGFLHDATPLFVADLKQLNRLTATLSKPKNLAQAQKSIRILPFKLTKTANYVAGGSIFNQYLCEFIPDLDTTGLPAPLAAVIQGLEAMLLNINTGGPRCDTAPGEL